MPGRAPLPPPVDLRGGARPGAGRPCTNTVRAYVTFSQPVYAKLLRMAKDLGLRRTRGGGTPYLGTVIGIMAGREPDAQEPEYLRLARELTLTKS